MKAMNHGCAGARFARLATLIIMAAFAGQAAALEVSNPSTERCLDSFGRAGEAQMYPCHGQGGNQEWLLNWETGELRNPSSGMCLDSWGQAGSARIHDCHGQRGNQEWVYNEQLGELRNPSSGLCLDSWGREGAAVMTKCHGQRGNQRFELKSP